MSTKNPIQPTTAVHPYIQCYVNGTTKFNDLPATAFLLLDEDWIEYWDGEYFDGVITDVEENIRLGNKG